MFKRFGGIGNKGHSWEYVTPNFDENPSSDLPSGYQGPPPDTNRPERPDLLKRNHNVVYWRAAYNLYKSHPSTDILDLILKNGGDKESPDEDLRADVEALMDDSVVLWYLGEKETELTRAGFCVLEGFVNNSWLPMKENEKASLRSVTVERNS